MKAFHLESTIKIGSFKTHFNEQKYAKQKNNKTHTYKKTTLVF